MAGKHSETGDGERPTDPTQATPAQSSPRAGSGNYAGDWITEPPRVHAGPDHERGGGFGGPQDSESRGEAPADAAAGNAAMPGEVPGARPASAQHRHAGDRPADGDGNADAASSYRGVGPKDYRHSDERLREFVCEILSDDPRVDASQFTVEVKDGEVCLDGQVPVPEMKSRAEALIAQCGVVGIHNRLRIVDRRAPPSAPGDGR